MNFQKILSLAAIVGMAFSVNAFACDQGCTPPAPEPCYGSGCDDATVTYLAGLNAQAQSANGEKAFAVIGASGNVKASENGVKMENEVVGMTLVTNPALSDASVTGTTWLLVNRDVPGKAPQVEYSGLLQQQLQLASGNLYGDGNYFNAGYSEGSALGCAEPGECGYEALVKANTNTGIFNDNAGLSTSFAGLTLDVSKLK